MTNPRSLPEETPTTGPLGFLTTECQRLDGLLSLLIADADYTAKREASEALDDAFHSAIHALRRLRQLADQLGPRWSSLAPSGEARDTDEKRDAERWRFVLPRLWIQLERTLSGEVHPFLTIAIAKGRLPNSVVDCNSRFIQSGDAVCRAIDAARLHQEKPT